jgi:hypothetical protein
MIDDTLSSGELLRSDSEPSDFQKRLVNIDNVILCVAEAEKMINDIGKSLLPDDEQLQELLAKSGASMKKRKPEQVEYSRFFSREVSEITLAGE